MIKKNLHTHTWKTLINSQYLRWLTFLIELPSVCKTSDNHRYWAQWKQFYGCVNIISSRRYFVSFLKFETWLNKRFRLLCLLSEAEWIVWRHFVIRFDTFRASAVYTDWLTYLNNFSLNRIQFVCTGVCW